LNTLYLRIPAKHTAQWPATALAFALCSQEGAIVREGRSSLPELAGLIAKSDVVLLIAASDVTLIELAIPPMPESKLKLALPNLVEDQLMADPADCVFVLSAKLSSATNQRTIAVAQRSWLQQLSTSLFALGANQIKAFPAQLSLPFKAAQTTARIAESAQDGGVTLSLRLDVDQGFGMLLQETADVAEYLTTLYMMVPTGPVLLQLPAELMATYKSVIEANPIWAERTALQASSWPDTIYNAKLISVNLMAGLNTAQTNRIQWQIWRWPLILAGLLALVNIIGLNSEYWTLKREAQTLRLGMSQTYKATFPKESVVPFPLEQMKKNLDLAQRNSGQASSDDFTALLSQFGSVWQTLPPERLPKLVSVEYKDHGLLVQIKGDMPQTELEQALTVKGLSLKKNNAEVWQVRNLK
jgi:general secretion pathway protein L